MKNKEQLQILASKIYTLKKQLTKTNSIETKKKIMQLYSSLSLPEMLEINDIIQRYSNKI